MDTFIKLTISTLKSTKIISIYLFWVVFLLPFSNLGFVFFRFDPLTKSGFRECDLNIYYIFTKKSKIYFYILGFELFRFFVTVIETSYFIECKIYKLTIWLNVKFFKNGNKPHLNRFDVTLKYKLQFGGKNLHTIYRYAKNACWYQPSYRSFCKWLWTQLRWNLKILTCAQFCHYLFLSWFSWFFIRPVSII